MTTRGFKEAEFKQTADLIVQALNNVGNEGAILRIKKEVSEMCASYPTP